jgi:hypothetical protein
LLGRAHIAAYQISTPPACISWTTFDQTALSARLVRLQASTA